MPMRLAHLPPNSRMQLASLRQKLQVVLNKTKNDDALIQALRHELVLAARSESSGHLDNER